MNMYDTMSYKLQCFMNICQTWLALASKNRAWQLGNICDSSDDLWQAFANGHLCGIALPFHQEVPGGLASPEMASNASFVKAVTLKGREKKNRKQASLSQNHPHSFGIWECPPPQIPAFTTTTSHCSRAWCHRGQLFERWPIDNCQTCSLLFLQLIILPLQRNKAFR